MSNFDHENWIRELKETASRSDKSWGFALFLSFFGGFLGADLFYLDRIGLGLLKLITLGGFGAWWIVDVARLLAGRMPDGDGGIVRRPF